MPVGGEADSTQSRIALNHLAHELRPLVGRHVLAVSLQGVQRRLSSHPWVASVELRRELEESKARIEDAIGRPVMHLSCPGGRASRRVAESVGATLECVARNRLLIRGRRHAAGQVLSPSLGAFLSRCAARSEAGRAGE